MKQVLATVLLLVAAPFALAHEDAKNCRNISSDLERLSCYDDQFQPIVADADPIEETGEWNIRVETSPIDDSSNVFLSLDSNEPIRSRFGKPGPMVLNLMCRENTTDLSIFFNGLHMSDHQYGQVTYRIDKQRAQKKNFVESTSNQHLGLWGGRKSIPFIKELIDHDTLLIEATPYGENSVLAIFDLTGIDHALSELRVACNW